MMKQENQLHTLISLDDFMSLLGVDDREDKTARFCLVTSTCTIEQYCKRRLLRRKHFERIEYIGNLFLPLREYPVSKIFAAFAMSNEQGEMNNGEMIEPEYYRVIPDLDCFEDLPYSIELSPALYRYRGLSAIKVIYSAGYSTGNVPPDLASACLELAAWNMNRYRGRRIGMTGNVRGTGKEGEHFEMSMPENVKLLIEPYRRRTI